MINKTKVLIDCEKIKYPNTGLYSFCMELSRALESAKSGYDVDTNYLVTKKSAYLLTGRKTRILNLFDKLYFRCNKAVDVFHMTFQLGKYVPPTGKQKVILTIHDLNFLYEGNKTNLEKLKRKIQKHIDRADYLVAISEFARQDVCDHLNVGNKPFDVIYNGCSFFTGKQAEAATHKPQHPFIFSIGTVLPKKNFHVLPCLVKDKNLELIIAGNLSAYQDTIMAEAFKYGVQDQVKIIGPVSDADKDWYYRNCEAFVFPSIAEGFGLPVIEAMHYGKPTFISKHTSLPEIGKDYCYYFDTDFNREQMQIEFDEGLRNFQLKDVRKQIAYAESFSWQNAAEKYCEIYKKLNLYRFKK